MTVRQFMSRSAAATLGILVAATSLTACSQSTPQDTKPTAPVADYAPNAANKEALDKFVQSIQNKWQGKTLKIMGVKDPWLPAFQKSLKRFEEISGATVAFDNYSYDDTYSKELLAGQQKSTDADIIMFDLPWVGKFAETGFVEPLQDRIAAADPNLMMYDDFYKVMREGSVYDGKTLGLPFAPYFVLPVHNKDVLAQAGVQIPKTVDEFVAACKTIKDKTGIAGTAINNQSGTPVGQAYFEWIYNNGGRPFASETPTNTSGKYYSDMTPQFSSPESKATVKMFKDLMDTCQPPGAINVAWQERYSAFATGQAAMISPWNYDIPPLDDPQQSAVAGKYEASTPYVKDGVKPNTPVGGWEMGINAYSTQKDLAWDFMQWFSSPAVNASFLADGGFASRYSVSNNVELRKQYPWLATQASVVDNAFPAFRPQIPEAFEIMNTLGRHIGAYLAGQKSLDQAMSDADSEIGGFLKTAGYTVNSK